MNYQTPLARARGLGSARLGTHHWWRQRVTAVALIPLTFWVGVGLVRLPEATHEQVIAWVTQPWNTLVLLAFILMGFVHAMLGLQVVIEDYVHVDWLKILGILAVKLLLGFLALAACFATLRIVFLG